ncbi:MAG: hypothetical protein J6I46_12465 [Ruminococcus sp.]|nr:hypothetical protein [Ruminococcus sp.]MBP3798569.1 hypothetical protein [Ruminococcus sp.]
MASKIAKILAAFVDKKKLGKKLGILVLSIAFGLIFLLVLPVVMMKSLGNISGDSAKPSINTAQLTESNIKAHMSDSNRELVERMERDGLAIEEKMKELGIKEQTVKAQLIYMTEVEKLADLDADAYCNLFKYATDDKSLLDSLNQNYGLSIDYEEFMHVYTLTMNAHINEYMFSDTDTKNAADLAAWADNAYISGWKYRKDCYGEKIKEELVRCADEAGLIEGYLRYDPDNKKFGEKAVVGYTIKGEASAKLEVKGIGLYDGEQFGIYVGNDKVVYASKDKGCIVKESVTEGHWTKWCTYDDIRYPSEIGGR